MQTSTHTLQPHQFSEQRFLFHPSLLTHTLSLSLSLPPLLLALCRAFYHLLSLSLVSALSLSLLVHSVCLYFCQGLNLSVWECSKPETGLPLNSGAMMDAGQRLGCALTEGEN